MNEYNDEALNVQLQTSEWILEKVNKLLTEYKECKTENCKNKLKTKLQLLLPRLNYEANQLKTIIEKAKDEGFEF